jgi:C1A family cysteine protease
MYKSFAALAFTGVASAINDIQFRYIKYVSEFNKNYNTLEEFNMRMELFRITDTLINEHNSDDTATSQMGHNFLSDWTHAEKKTLTGLKGELTGVNHQKFVSNGAPVPNAVNWVTAGKVGPVKDQGQCGSCWAFSATCSVESAIAVATNTTPLNLSEQQLVSCSGAYGNQGCNGGWYYWAWDYGKVNAQTTTASYPYTSGTTTLTGTCNWDGTGVAIVDSYVQVGQTNADIVAAINLKPVSVAIDAARAVFQQYTSGVITTGCGTMLDHAVMAVGYGKDVASGLDYFLVRNSWGASWGDQGYVKIAQSSTGTAPGYCGINKAVYYVNAHIQ